MFLPLDPLLISRSPTADVLAGHRSTGEVARAEGRRGADTLRLARRLSLDLPATGRPIVGGTQPREVGYGPQSHDWPSRQDERGSGENDPVLRANPSIAASETRRVGLPSLRSDRRGATAVRPSSPLAGGAAPTAQDTDGHTQRRRAPPSSSSASRVGSGAA